MQTEPTKSVGDIAYELDTTKKPGNALGGMVLDGVFASEAVDSSGESLSIAGCDISSMQAGDGLGIFEHKKGAESSPNDQLGKIVYAKKIFGPEDCEDQRQLWFWNKVGCPLLYGRVRLYDAAGHPGAQALAAQIRDHHANDEKLTIRWSVDGSTLQREGGKLLRTIARDVALTARPCNKTCDSGLLQDPQAADFPPLVRRESMLGHCSMVMELQKGERPLPVEQSVLRLMPLLVRRAVLLAR